MELSLRCVVGLHEPLGGAERVAVVQPEGLPVAEYVTGTEALAVRQVEITALKLGVSVAEAGEEDAEAVAHCEWEGAGEWLAEAQ